MTVEIHQIQRFIAGNTNEMMEFPAMFNYRMVFIWVEFGCSMFELHWILEDLQERSDFNLSKLSTNKNLDVAIASKDSFGLQPATTKWD